MRIGFDVDGVLANFTSIYQRLVVEPDWPNLPAGDAHLEFAKRQFDGVVRLNSRHLRLGFRSRKK